MFLLSATASAWRGRRTPASRSRPSPEMTATASAATGKQPLHLRVGSALASYGGFAPAIVLLGLFFIVPLGIIVCYSFWETYNYAVVHHWTFDNYRYFFTVPTYVTT